MVTIKRMRYAATAALVATGLAAAACSTPQQAAGGDSSGEGPIKVGLLYSKSGPLADYGRQYIQGFKAGLDYATDGTGKVNGREIEVAQRDGAGDPAKAVSAAKELIGKGYRIIAGTTSSGVGIQLAPLAERNKVLHISGPAATDALTGAGTYTFRSGRQTWQDIMTAAAFAGELADKKILVFAQDTTFGQANVKAVETVMGGQDADVQSLLVPPDATDLTPFAAQAKAAGADLLFVAWAGSTSKAMWTALGQQGLFESTTVVTGLGGTKTWSAYGPVAGEVNFLAHYFAGAAGTEVEQAMIERVRRAGGTVDLFTVDGFTAAQMIVHAARQGDTPEQMVQALEGWSFEGVKGKLKIRAADHALLQPMYQAKLSDGEATVVDTVPAEAVAPPVTDK